MRVPITRPYFSQECRRRIREGIDEILASGRLMLGPYTEKLEAAFAERVGTPYAVSVNTCTTALQISLQHFEVAGSDVLVPSGSFLTDISTVRWAGGNPILVDMNPETLALDLDDLARKLTPSTKGIIWVHLTGVISTEYRAIQQFARDRGLFLIEDAAHAHGATIDGKEAGSLGDVGCFSFYPTKVITSGTGGMMTLADADHVRYAKQVRLLGRHVETGEIVQVGNDWFMDEIRACIGYYQFLELDDMLGRRRAIAGRYDDGLSNQPGIRLLDVPDSMKPAYYQYAIFLERAIDRDELSRRLSQNHGVSAKRIYIPTHREKIFRDLDDGTLGKTEDTLARTLCLPMSAAMTDEEVDTVIDAVITEVRAPA